MHSLLLKMGDYAPPPSGQSIFLNYLKFLYMGDFSSLPLHVFNHYLHQYDSWIFALYFGLALE